MKHYKIYEILNHFITDYKDKVVQVHHIRAKTNDTLYQKMYGLRRSARYDNGRRYEFADTTLESEYQKWKEKNETIDMYYGTAVVD